MRFKIFAITLILVLTALLVQAQRITSGQVYGTAWLLESDRRAFLADDYFDVRPDHNIIAVAILPESVTGDVVAAAWSYAIRYGADGLDLANYERAIEIMMERHPTWEVYATNGYLIRYGEVDASLDTQDPALTPTPEATTNP